MTRQEINIFNALLNTLNQFSLVGINEVSEKWIINVLDRSLPFFTHLISHYQFETLERITINRKVLGGNRRIKEIKFLKYPPADKITKYGRCNLPKQSVFYGSTMFMTAIDEMKPRVGDLITKSIWKLREPKPLRFCPIFHVQPTNGTFNSNSWELEEEFHNLVKRDFPKDMHEPVTNLSKFIAYHFSKIVNPNEDKQYLFSAYFANKILYEFENGTIDGIVYPSVQSHLSFDNIALKTNVFDDRYELKEVHESIVIKDPSDGDRGYFMDGLNECTDFENGKVKWGSKVRQPKDKVDFYKRSYGIEIE